MESNRPVPDARPVTSARPVASLVVQQPVAAVAASASAAQSDSGQSLSSSTATPLARRTALQQGASARNGGGSPGRDEKAVRRPSARAGHPASVDQDDASSAREFERLCTQSARSRVVREADSRSSRDPSETKASDMDSWVKRAIRTASTELVGYLGLKPLERRVEFLDMLLEPEDWEVRAFYLVAAGQLDDFFRSPQDEQLVVLWKTATPAERRMWMHKLMHASSLHPHGAIARDMSTGQRLAARHLTLIAELDQPFQGEESFVHALVKACAVEEGMPAALLISQHRVLKSMFELLPPETARLVLQVALNPRLTPPDKAPAGALGLLMATATPALLQPLAQDVAQWIERLDALLARKPGGKPLSPERQSYLLAYRAELEHILTALGQPSRPDPQAHAQAFGRTFSFYEQHDQRWDASPEFPSAWSDLATLALYRASALERVFRRLPASTSKSLGLELIQTIDREANPSCKQSVEHLKELMRWATRQADEAGKDVGISAHEKAVCKQWESPHGDAACPSDETPAGKVQWHAAPDAKASGASSAIPAGPAARRAAGSGTAATPQAGPTPPPAPGPGATLGEISTQVLWYEGELGLTGTSSTSLDHMRERLADLRARWAARRPG